MRHENSDVNPNYEWIASGDGKQFRTGGTRSLKWTAIDIDFVYLKFRDFDDENDAFSCIWFKHIIIKAEDPS